MNDKETLDLLNLGYPTKLIEDEIDIPKIEIKEDEYQQSWAPWCKALILKPLGKSIPYKTLEQRLKRLWHLEWGCKLNDLEKGYFIAHFYSAEDYNYVLEGGPWIIKGHYLSIANWKSNF